MPKVLVIHSAVSKQVRGWVIPDRESELHDPRHVRPGELGIIVDVDDAAKLSHEDCCHHVARHHGITREEVAYVHHHVLHVATGRLVHTGVYDPDVDYIPGHIMVRAWGK